MARPTKCRRVCAMPRTLMFAPDSGSNGEIVLMVDEYETIRLIDLLCLTQEDCAVQMQVARTTVQSIYDMARKKIADALIHGKTLVIKGGQYQICADAQTCCGKNCAHRRCDIVCNHKKTACLCNISNQHSKQKGETT
ncbi:MAG: DUF134 domain-containing protein [Ruthenibacterium sp.]